LDGRQIEFSKKRFKNNRFLHIARYVKTIYFFSSFSKTRFNEILLPLRLRVLAVQNPQHRPRRPKKFRPFSC